MRNTGPKVKRVLQNTALVLVSVALTMGLVEIVLAIDGRYDGLAKQALVASPAIYERPSSAIEHMSHPDLGVLVEVRFDSAGVRNHSAPSTERKKNIIGVFGDSYTENRRIDDRFTFTSLLDGVTGTNARLVNYGVDGYGLDQSYLRYKKYEAHDIRHVVYLFSANDLRNLYETGLVDVTPAGEITFKAPRVRWHRRVLGRLRVTYLTISAYHRIVGLLGGKGERKAFVQDLNAVDQQSRDGDAFSDAMHDDFLAETPQVETLNWARAFLLVLRKWQSEVTLRGRSFTVLVLPDSKHTELAAKLMKEFDGRVSYLGPGFGPYAPNRFKDDAHWNEYGNLRAAELIAGNPDLPFHQDIVNPTFLDGWKARIDEYYRAHR